MNASFNLFVFVLFWASFLASDEQNQVEIEALTAFKLNLHDPLGALNGWDPPMPAASCDWGGVACTDNRSPSFACLASNSVS
ncbi:hypothetical protein SLE2022_096260 [Rubroshorea leprosula]